MIALLLMVPTIDVYTMGQGEHPFTRFGHAAICVTDEASPDGRCYNYGTADFDTPGPLTWRFLRGEAVFWVSVSERARMLAWYRHEDRSVWRQRLVLTSTQAVRLSAALAESAKPENRYYRYHHFEDNCTTRIRDRIDEVLAGELSQKTRLEADHDSYREYARQGLAGNLPLLLLAELILGRAADHPRTAWEAMFHPDELREELARHLALAPVVEHQRSAPLPGGSAQLGRATLLALGLLLAALAWSRRGRALAAIVLTIPALVVYALAILGQASMLRVNEALLVLVPTDLALAFVQGRALTHYARLRLAGLVAVLVLSTLGIFVQPLAAPIAFAGLPLSVIILGKRR